MTLAMPDSIRTLDLPTGYPAYLGYVDGHYPTITGYTDANGVYQPPLGKLFPAAHLIRLTVTGGTLAADGCDSETQDLTAIGAVNWAARKLASAPDSRPVIYASVEGDPGYGMHYVLAALMAQSIPFTRVRLLSAHYEWRNSNGADPINSHICGPSTCNLISVDMDGTQWTDVWPGAREVVDLSAVREDFFTTTEAPMGVQIPGVPGIWLTYDAHIDYQTGAEYVIGTGTSGRLYYVKRPAGGSWPAQPTLMPL